MLCHLRECDLHRTVQTRATRYVAALRALHFAGPRRRRQLLPPLTPRERNQSKGWRAPRPPPLGVRNQSADNCAESDGSRGNPDGSRGNPDRSRVNPTVRGRAPPPCRGRAARRCTPSGAPPSPAAPRSAHARLRGSQRRPLDQGANPTATVGPGRKFNGDRRLKALIRRRPSDQGVDPTVTAGSRR
eukprot:1178896-Prorocentrum_minimum.AAC.1